MKLVCEKLALIYDVILNYTRLKKGGIMRFSLRANIFVARQR